MKQREIKFRAWDKKDGRMSAPFEIQDREIKYINRDGEEYMADTYDLDCGDFEVMQFTGLLDKNGKEIYEGDIVKYDYNSIPIEHCVEEVRMDLEWGCWKFGTYMLEPTIKRTLEVIGNIYENPELLKP